MKIAMAARLMKRPIRHRTITAPSPRGTGTVSGLLVDHDGEIATIKADPSQLRQKQYKREWEAPLADLKYR